MAAATSVPHMIDPGGQLARFHPGGPRPFSSQMLLNEDHTLRMAVRRRQSTIPLPADRGSSNPQVSTDVQLRSDVFSAIYERMEASELPLGLVDHNLLQFLLPHTKTYLDSWYRLLKAPMTVTDAELELMFALRKCTSQTPAPAQGQVIFYVRSFAFEASELEAVIHHLESNGILLRKSAAWRKVLDDLPPTTMLFLRYCGQTTNSAYARHYDDVTSIRNSEATHVIQATRLLYPEIVDEVNVFEFLKGTLPIYINGVNELRDLREQATIALFDLDTLLNTQSGGKHIDTNPTVEIEVMFHDLIVRTLNRFEQQTSACDQSVLNDIATYLETIQQYANNNPDTTGTHAASFTDRYRAALLRQVTPVTIEKTKYTPMVMIGHDPTIEEFQGGKAVWETDSFVKSLLTSVFAMFGRREGYSLGIPERLFQQNMIPFVDLFPWCKKSPRDLDVVMGRMRYYLQITNPIVVVTFGEHVSSVARGDFVHAYGLKSGTLGIHIGQPVIRNYSDPDSFDDEQCVITIPCYHPGSGSYGSFRGRDFVDVFTLTMIIAWTMTYYSMRLNDEAIAQKYSKKAFLQGIIIKTNAKLGQGSTFRKMFDEARVKLKETARRGTVAAKSHVPIDPDRPHGRGSVQANIRDTDRVWGASMERRPFDKLRLEIENMTENAVGTDFQRRVERWEGAKTEVEMVMQCGWSLYPPQSVESNQQARQLASKHYATLYTSRTGANVGQVRAWAEKVDQGKFYYFEATNESDRRWVIPHLLTIFASEDVDVMADPTWYQDDQLLSAASSKTQKWFEEKVLQSSTKPDMAVTRGLESLTALMYKKDPDLSVVQRALMSRELKAAPKVHMDPTESLEGVQVDVIAWRNDQASAALVLSWVDESGRTFALTGHSRDKFELCLPPVCMTTSKKDTRHIHFVQDGIDIRTADGRPLKAQGTTCTVPLSQVRLMLKGDIQQAFIKLWERETHLDPENSESVGNEAKQDASVLSGPYYPAEAFDPGPKGRKNQKLDVGSRGVTINEKKAVEHIKAYLPLQAGDELWLLHKFLTEQYPNAGRMDASNPNVIPNADSAWTRLSAFCSLPKYRQHPMQQHLKDVADMALEVRNTAGCDTMLKLAIEQFLRPGSVRERKQVWIKSLKAKKWGIWYKLSANPPSTRTLPPSVNPQLLHNEVVMTVRGDDVQVDENGDLVAQSGGATIDDPLEMFSQEQHEERGRALARTAVPWKQVSRSPSPMITTKGPTSSSTVVKGLSKHPQFFVFKELTCIQIHRRSDNRFALTLQLGIQQMARTMIVTSMC